MNFSDFKAEVAERLSNPDTLSSIATTSYRIARLSGFCAVASAAEDIRERERLGTGAKLGIAGCVGSAAIGTAALVRSINS
jgi:hypothetical protein